MKNVLILNSSPSPKESISTQLTSFFKDTLLATEGFKVVTRELGVSPPSHLTEMAVSGFFIDPATHNEDQKQALSEGLMLIEELKQSDIVIIGAAMHNHTITSGLKAYIDQVTRPGLTFKYLEDGPHGLVTGKQVFVVISAGGDYSIDETRGGDLITPLLKVVLGFIGMDDIQFIPVFGVYAGSDALERAVNDAKKTILTEVARLE